MKGTKYDEGKLRPTLIPRLGLNEVLKTFEYGLGKYERDNWRKMPDMEMRCLDAAGRHYDAYCAGEENAPDSDLNHLAHAAANLLMILEVQACRRMNLTVTNAIPPMIQQKDTTSIGKSKTQANQPSVQYVITPYGVFLETEELTSRVQASHKKVSDEKE